MNRQELLNAIVSAIYENTTGDITGQSLQDTLKEIVGAFTFIDKAAAQPSGGMLPGVLYNLGELTGAVSLSFAAGDYEVQHYYFTFDTGNNLPTITWPSLVWAWNEPPQLAVNKHYEVSVLNGHAFFVEMPIS